MALKTCKDCGNKISKKAKSCPSCGAPNKDSSLTFKAILLCIAVWLLVVITQDESYRFEPIDSNKKIILNDIELHSYKSISDLNVLEVDFDIDNKSNYKISNIEITCNHFSKSNMDLGKNVGVVYDVLNANSSKKFPKMNLGFVPNQIDLTICSITDFDY